MTKYVCLGYDKTIYLNTLRKPFNIKKEVSIILPTYNEEKNIYTLVEALRKEFSGLSYEIVILDDDSKDKTPKIIDELTKKKDVLAIHRYGKKGYFSAYQDAISMSNGLYFIMMDADFSHTPETARKLFDLRKKSDIVSASRYIKRGFIIAPFLRKYGSMFINNFARFIIDLKQTDITNEFLIMKKSDFKKIKFLYEPAFGEFDFELLYRAGKIGLNTLEIPCIYVFRSKGSSAMGAGLKEAKSLSKFALNYIKMAFKIKFYG